MRQSINDSIIILTLVIGGLFIIIIDVAIRNDVGIDDKVNLTDLFSNVLNIVALYATIFFVLKLTSEAAASGKEVETEKALVIDRLKRLYEKVEELHEKVEIGTLNFQETILTFNRIERSHESIVTIINSANSRIKVDQTMLTAHVNDFATSLGECLDVLTFTPLRTSSSSTPSLVTIASNVITVTVNGVQQSASHLGDLKSGLDTLLLEVNRA